MSTMSSFVLRCVRGGGPGIQTQPWLAATLRYEGEGRPQPSLWSHWPGLTTSPREYSEMWARLARDW